MIESRCGLLHLPLSPIHGLGGVLVSVFLLPYVDNPFALFFLGMAVCTVLEHVASFVMEKLFGSVFWDYSAKPLNLQGRICLQYSSKRDGTALPTIDTPIGRLVDRLVPDVVMINTFPRMSQIVEYMELTGEHRKLIVADLHIGTPSPRHLRHKEDLARAQAAEGIAG